MSALAPSRPHAWQQGDRVVMRPDACWNRKYADVKALVGVIELANDQDIFSAVGPIANVRFAHENFPSGILIRDIPFPHLCPASEETEPEKTKRRSPLNMKVVKDTRSESAKQNEAIAWLKARGYEVLVVGQYMKKVQCEECGTWFWPKGFGNSVGYPDVTIYHPERWSTASGRIPVLLQEWKQDEKADRKQRQVEIAETGASTFIWSLQMCLQDLVAFEEEMGFVPHPDALQYLERHEEGRRASARWPRVERVPEGHARLQRGGDCPVNL